MRSRMSEAIVVVTKICAMFLVLLLGYAARRAERVDAATTALLGALTADVCLPALTFSQLLATVDSARLAAGWMTPLLGMGVLLLGQLVGLLLARPFATPTERPTFVFLCATANWIYLPLPIVEALHGARGVAALLLLNVGAQFVLWTVGVATLRGGRIDARALTTLAKNPGLVATVAGIALALVLPKGPPTGVIGHAWRAIVEGTTIVGSATIPLSLLVTGAQLGGSRLTARPRRATIGVMLARLAIAPSLALAIVWTARRVGVSLPSPATEIAVLVAGMPVAVSTGILTAKYAGDERLAAEATFASTLVSVATTPVIVWIFHYLQ
jgi:predicted permease